MRRIKNAEVKRLALCKRGKNGLKTLFKSADGKFELETLVKGDAETGELLAVMWPKGLADSDGDFADTVEAIKSMTSSLIKNGGALDIEHDGKVLEPEAAYLSEVFTIQADDSRFHGWKDYQGEVQDVTGGAAVKIQIDDPKLRAAYRDGDWDGVSLFGPAAVEHVDIVAASHRVANKMGRMLENQMTEAEFQAALAAQEVKTAALVKSAIEAALATKGAPEDKAANEGPAEEVAPTFTGDVTNPEALAEYENALRSFEMRKAVLKGDMTSDDILKLRKSLTVVAPTTAELNKAGIKAEESDSKEVRALQVQLFKARKSSNVPERSSTSGASEEELLAKANHDEGMELAKLINMNLGGAPDSMKIVNG